jgi:deoxyribonuclease-1
MRWLKQSRNLSFIIKDLGIIRVLSMKRYFLWLSMLMLLSACNQDDVNAANATTVPSQKSSHSDKQSLANLPKSPASFESAKKILYNQIYQGHDITFYCGCDYDPKSKIVDWKSCGYIPRKNAERASRIEAEHVMPAHQFGNFRQCWREPKKVCPEKDMTGRQCCELKTLFLKLPIMTYTIYFLRYWRGQW